MLVRRFRFVLSLVALAFTMTAHAAASQQPVCVDKTVPFGSLRAGELLRVSFGADQVGIYRRSTKDIQYLEAAETRGVDDKIPGWWSRENTPIGSEQVAISKSRSKSREVFVFWVPSPVYGCYVLHEPPSTRLEVESELTTRGTLGNAWQGGFFDPCVGIGYDYAGRVALQLQGAKVPPPSLRELSLVLPSYEIKPDSREVVLRCK